MSSLTGEWQLCRGASIGSSCPCRSTHTSDFVRLTTPPRTYATVPCRETLNSAGPLDVVMTLSPGAIAAREGRGAARDLGRGGSSFNSMQCDPPLEAAEVRQMPNHALTQPDRADFDPPQPAVVIHDAPAPAAGALGSVVVNLGDVQPEPVHRLRPFWLPRRKGGTRPAIRDLGNR